MANFFKKMVGIDESKNNENNSNVDDENYNDTPEDNQSDNWLEETGYEEGQLSIDVYEKPDKLIVKSTIESS